MDVKLVWCVRNFDRVPCRVACGKYRCAWWAYDALYERDGFFLPNESLAFFSRRRWNIFRAKVEKMFQ